MPGGPHTNFHPNNTKGPITVGHQVVEVLWETVATFSVLTEAPGPLSSGSTTIIGLSGPAKCYYASHPLSYNWDSVLFSRVSNRARVSFTVSGDILREVQASVFMNMEPALSLLLTEQNVNPRVWADGKTVH